MKRVKHIGKSANRLNLRVPGWVNKERVFSREWIKENRPASYLNGGIGTLRWLLAPEADHRFPLTIPASDATVQRCRTDLRFPPFPLTIPEVTQAEATAAASVVQWLGSNCGWSFMEECIRKCGYRITPKERK